MTDYMKRFIGRRIVEPKRGRNGEVIGWSIDRLFGQSVLSGTVIRPNPVDGRVPLAEPVHMVLLYDTGGVFGCHDSRGQFRAATHVFKKGAPDVEPFPYLT